MNDVLVTEECLLKALQSSTELATLSAAMSAGHLEYQHSNVHSQSTVFGLIFHLVVPSYSSVSPPRIKNIILGRNVECVLVNG